ncbi:SRPBCC domain-containing protein [Pelagovum pacificum]|uniref:Activator of Hsp90 ATPase homologue 1/2-like C-terminal domain-containing protein n=1 Tax=Pelagovum pacificum TaxID=2588711 RepID=A0A5C5GDL1_9RHOB|nr:SRPBCC domain-containing protein [Pelagovum pacificum]QQA44068.1 SRPBCC domain-containing protein [Pelagovum pacificum]TNY32803.1 hypothetical protein FHY64_05875 [Pelagovum pacificum]
MDPIKKSLTVPLTPAESFRLFTEGMGEWWPSETHSLSAATGDLPARIEVEPRVGGQVLETLQDGRVMPWGRVTRWDEGRAFGVDWHVGRDEEEATDLLVVFSPVEAGTRVELTHGGFDRLGEAATALQGNYETGWDHVLARCYAGHCKMRVTA